MFHVKHFRNAGSKATAFINIIKEDSLAGEIFYNYVSGRGGMRVPALLKLEERNQRWKATF